jgi:hypothetical protein
MSVAHSYVSNVAVDLTTVAKISHHFVDGCTQGLQELHIGQVCVKRDLIQMQKRPIQSQKRPAAA